MTDPNDRARDNNPPRRVNSSNGRDDKRGVWIAVIGALVAFCAVRRAAPQESLPMVSKNARMRRMSRRSARHTTWA